MRTKKGLLRVLLIALVAFVAMPAGQARAASLNPGVAIAGKVFASADPQAAYNALSAQDKALFAAAEAPARVVLTSAVTGLGANAGRTLNSPITPDFAGCWAMQDSAAGYSLLNVELFKYGQTTEVCVSGGSVYYVGVYNVWQQPEAPGWRYDTRWISTFNVGWEGRGLVQWEFILGAGGWDIQYNYPCLQGRLNANGYDNWWNQSCNLS